VGDAIPYKCQGLNLSSRLVVGRGLNLSSRARGGSLRQIKFEFFIFFVIFKNKYLISKLSLVYNHCLKWRLGPTVAANGGREQEPPLAMTAASPTRW
jgi:hypothetical protein